MKDISATDASRRFADMLDAIEHDGETYTVYRRGRAVARMIPPERPTGNAGAVLAALDSTPVDPGWADELADLREWLNASAHLDGAH